MPEELSEQLDQPEREEAVDTKESLNICTYNMIRLCLNLEKAIRLKEGKERVLSILGNMEIVHNNLGAIAFSECDIQDSDCKNYFVEDDEKAIEELKTDTTKD